MNLLSSELLKADKVSNLMHRRGAGRGCGAVCSAGSPPATRAGPVRGMACALAGWLACARVGRLFRRPAGDDLDEPERSS